MSLKLSLCFALTASLTCFGQMTTMGGYASTSNASAANVAVYPADAPLVSTPDVALPGSGPAVGAPLTTSNDSRTSTAPSIANPNLALLPGLQNGGQSALETNAASGSNASPGFEFGIQNFVSGLPGSSNSGLSLAQIAARNKAQRRKAAKSFDNGSIAQLNAAGVRTGNLEAGNMTTPASSNMPASPAGNSLGAGTLLAQNQTPALPQSDQGDQAVQSSQPVQRPSATAAQQKHAQAEQAAPASTAPSSTASTSNASATQSSSTAAPLPQTASSLPLILLVGALGIGGGALYWLRR